jgi:hypothetical protein
VLDQIVRPVIDNTIREQANGVRCAQASATLAL